MDGGGGEEGGGYVSGGGGEGVRVKEWGEVYGKCRGLLSEGGIHGSGLIERVGMSTKCTSWRVLLRNSVVQTSGDSLHLCPVLCSVPARVQYICHMSGSNQLTLLSQVYSSPWQPEFLDWAFTYPRHIDRFNPTPPVSKQTPAENPVPAHPAIDIMLTHGPPMNILDQTHYGEEHVGCAHLRRAVERCKPRLHCFGHIHEGWGAERMEWKTKKVERIEQTKEETFEKRAAQIDISSEGEKPLGWGEETLFVNASIMNVQHRPVNAPWIVDLDLPRGEDTG